MTASTPRPTRCANERKNMLRALITEVTGPNGFSSSMFSEV